MPSVVFLRGVNVGGHKAFRPSALAAQLKGLEVQSIGAAGTFIVRAAADEARIRKEFQKHLPFEAHLMVSPARDLLALVAADPFAKSGLPSADGQFITVIEKRLSRRPPLPIYAPEATPWQVMVADVRGLFVATLMRRVGRTPLYPNEVVEKRLGVPATTRGWPTILKIGEALRDKNL